MKLLVAVPVFNEEKYVAKVLREIRKYSRAAALSQSLAGHPVEIRVLVVDDGSTDGTHAVLSDLTQRGHIHPLTHPENRGYGQSLINAFRFADHHGYDWVITMDCDEQHEPCRIPLFVRECLKNDADIISGSRYLRADWADNGNGAPPPDRQNINRLITELLNSRLHLNLPGGMTDAFCGFKAHRTSALRRMNLSIPGYAFPMQFWAQADALRLRIHEIPVKLIYKDATRHFGGLLDDPAVRLQHYLEVLATEMLAAQELAAKTPDVPACFDAECAFAFE